MSILLIVVFVGCLIYHTYTDLKEMLLYDWVNAILAVSGIGYAYLETSLLDAAYGFVVGLVIMLGIYLISRGGLGEGDVKLTPCLGLWLGFENTLVALLLSFVIGAIIGLAYMRLRNKKMNFAIPFGPFLCLGALISFFYGNELLNLYWNYII